MLQRKSLNRNDFAFVIISLFISSILLKLFVYSDEKEPSYKDQFNDKYGIYALEAPEELSFAGEPVPLKNFDVLESFDKELLINTYWQSQTVMFIKRAHRYFPVIEPILEKNGVPDDFKYLALVESGLENLISPAGATGYWQFLKGTGREYGLEINDEIDERYHIEKSTEAACKYFVKAYDKFGSWTMAAASYNMGRTNLLRQIKRQHSKYYYDLILGEETGRYVYRLLAIKTILTNPEKYGFYIRTKDMYKPFQYYTVKIDSAVSDFSRFAYDHDINYKILKVYNPWLRENYLTNVRNKTYFIKIPKKNIQRDFKEPEQIDLDSLH